MRWQFIQDISKDGKGSVAYEAMNFYSNLKSKDYSHTVINILIDKLWMLQDDTEMFVVDPINDHTDMCNAAFTSYLETAMAESLIELEKNIPNKSDIRKKVWSSKNLNSGIQDLYQNDNLKNISSDSKASIAKASLWSYEDEILAMQSAVKSVIGYVLKLQINSVLEEGIKEISVSDFAQQLFELETEMNEASIPVRDNDAPSADNESLDLIASAMMNGEDTYINTVLDYILN